MSVKRCEGALEKISGGYEQCDNVATRVDGAGEAEKISRSKSMSRRKRR